MRRDRHTRIPGHLAALLAAVLVVLAAAPAGAGDHAEPVRDEVARAVHAHEKARARVARLRHDEKVHPKNVRDAERHRKAIRSDLWDMLWESGRQNGDPVALDPSGRSGRCRITPRKAPPAPRRDHSWTAPTRGYRLSARYAARGPHWAHRHTGQDFAVNRGSPVYAVGPGTVRTTTCGDAFGHQVLVRHRDGYFTQYAHLARILVRKGQRVSAGQRIGLAGATGRATGPHLHFEVRITPYFGSSVPPLPWLRRKDVQVPGRR